MATLNRVQLFLRFDTPDKASEIFTSTAKVPRGCDVEVNLGIFYKQNTLDLSNISSLHFEIAVGDKPSSARLVSKVIPASEFASAAIDKAAFLAGTAAHVTFNLTGDEMNPDLGNAASKNYFVILSGITNIGTRVAYGKGPFTIFEDGTSDNDTPPPEVSAPTYLTAAQTQALIAAALAGGGGGGGGSAIDYLLTSLAGGGIDALDSVATAALALGTVKQFVANGQLRAFQLIQNAVLPDAETLAAGLAVVPVDNDPATNHRWWKSVQ